MVTSELGGFPAFTLEMAIARCFRSAKEYFLRLTTSNLKKVFWPKLSVGDKF
jgi:hypothetical protein